MSRNVNLAAPINPDCPRIAHESGVVLGCQVDHVKHPDAPHATVTGVVWGDDDRIAHAALEPHHRLARFRAEGEAPTDRGLAARRAAVLDRLRPKAAS